MAMAMATATDAAMGDQATHSCLPRMRGSAAHPDRSGPSPAIRACRICGCTQTQPCLAGDADGYARFCAWHPEFTDICTRCVERAIGTMSKCLARPPANIGLGETLAAMDADSLDRISIESALEHEFTTAPFALEGALADNQKTDRDTIEAVATAKGRATKTVPT
jgi:hypothetical protein